MLEEWKQYKDFDYAFSNLGRIYNLKSHNFLNGDIKGTVDIYCLTGRNRIHLCIGRVVYELFVGPIPKGFVLQHIDKNFLNNSLDNLIIVPRSKYYKAGKFYNKRIRCLETNKIYKSLTECSKSISHSKMALYRHLKYNSPNNFEGFHYVYEEDYQESMS